MAQRDVAAFSDFALSASSGLHRTAYLIVGDRQLAEDLVQEALVRTYVSWPKLRDPHNAGAFARRVMVNTALSWFRRKGWNAERVAEQLPEHGVSDAADRLGEQDQIWTALSKLPVRQRTVLVLRYFDDLTEAQAADLMGCAVGTVKSQAFAGLRKMREELGRDVLTEADPDQAVNQ